MMAWVLRPFVGSLDAPVSFFRPEAWGNACVELFHVALRATLDTDPVQATSRIIPMMEQARSPFPGMDPYLEARWSDVHVKLIGFMGEAIQPLLPPDLRARGEERLLLESEEVDRWLQIIDVTSGNRVVTAIEILSPWNKAAGRLNRQYLQKSDDYAKAGVSVIEIDLLRYPPRSRLPVTEGDIPADRRSAYVTCVRLGWEPETWRAYPMPLHLPLPTLPIPLRQTDAEIGVALQPLVDRVYIAGGHDDIEYLKPPDPPLSASDAAWASELTTRRTI